MDLQKNSVINIKKEDGTFLKNVKIWLRWDVGKNTNMDLDLFIVRKLANWNKTTAYFNDRTAIKWIYLSEDNLTGGWSWDDEYVIMKADWTENWDYFICVNIYTDGKKFAEVKNPKVFIYDNDTNKTLATFECWQWWSENGMIAWKITDTWEKYQFTAMGDYLDWDIKQIQDSL